MSNLVKRVVYETTKTLSHDDDFINAVASRVLEKNKESFMTLSDDSIFYDVDKMVELSGKKPATIRLHCRMQLIKSAKSGKNWSATKKDFEKYMNNEQ